jgi:hypothetical protein
MKNMNKKGAEMTIGTIIIIILAIVVLVVLVFGFTTGWSDLWSRITGLGGGEVNVQTIIQSCQIACSTQSVYDYCTRSRNLVFEEGGETKSMTCDQLDSDARAVGLSCEGITCPVVEEDSGDESNGEEPLQ